MKWFDSFKYKPKHGTQVWFWNRKLQRQELFNAFWEESAWNPKTIHCDYSPIWAYVFQGNEPISSQPERPNPEAIDNAWIKWKDLEPPKDVKGIFIKFDDDRIWTDAHYWGSDEYRIKTVGDAKPVSWTFMDRSPPKGSSKQC